MSADHFSEELETLRQHLMSLSLRATASPGRDSLLSEALEHLGTALEELNVTGEELRQQTEELAQTRETVEADRDWYRELFENAPEAHLVTDAEGVIRVANRAAACLLAVRREDLVGKPLVVFVAPGVRATFHERLTRLLRQRDPERPWALRLQPRDLPAFLALITVHRVQTTGGPVSLRWSLRHASAEPLVPKLARRSAERESILAALGRVAARISQHFTTELSTIRGQVERLHTPDLPPKFWEHLGTLKVAVSNATETVHRLQKFSRLRPAAPLKAMDLAAAVHDALVATASAQLRQGGIVVRTDLGELPRVLGHGVEIREALIHLILNAVEAMPRGGILAIRGRAGSPSSASTLPPAPWVTLSVTDTGVGMSDEVRQQLFEPFFTTKGVERAGLGLAAVHGIMRRQGGRVDVASDPGEGTTVTLWFQRAVPEVPEPPPPHGAERARRILVICSSEPIRQTFSGLLQQGGYTVIEATTGVEGLARLAEIPVDLVITDFQLLDMDGLEVTRAVRACVPGLPVVALAGGKESAIQVFDGTAEADRLLAGPPNWTILLHLIGELTADRSEPPNSVG